MGLADFLADAGRGTAIGQVAQAFGGQTTGQRNLDNFINQELPALVDQIHKAGSRDEITKAGQALITRGLQAGIPTGGLDKLMEMTVGPALQNVHSTELDKFREDLRGTEASPRPQGGNNLVKGPDIPAIPGRQIDPEMAVRLGQITGANAPQMREYLGTPGDLAAKQASTAKTQTEIDRENVAARQRQGLSNVPAAPGQPSMRDVGILNPNGLMQFMPPRNEDQQNQMLDLKRQGMENTFNLGLQRLQLQADKQAGGGGGARGPGDTETVTEAPATARDISTTRFAIANMAMDQGIDKLPPAEQASRLKQIASDMGWELEGTPTLRAPSQPNVLQRAFGAEEKIEGLGGTYSLKRKPKVVTKSSSGAAPAGRPIPAGKPTPASSSGKLSLDEILFGK